MSKEEKNDDLLLIQFGRNINANSKITNSEDALKIAIKEEDVTGINSTEACDNKKNRNLSLQTATAPNELRRPFLNSDNPHPDQQNISSSLSIREIRRQNLGKDTLKSDYAIVYIWKSRFFICAACDCGNCHHKRVGHVSMRLFRSNHEPLKEGYISIWQNAETKKPIFMNNLTEDENAEYGESASEKFIIHNLDIDRMQAEFIKIKANFRWTGCGSGFFRGVRDTNCSGLVARLLVAGGLDSYFDKPFNSGFLHFIQKCATVRSPCYDKAEDTVETTKSEVTCWSYTKRFLLLLLPLLFVIGFARISAINITNTMSIAENKNEAIAVFTVLLLFAACIPLSKLYRHCTYIKHCGGITPDDVSYLLNFLTAEHDTCVEALKYHTSTKPKSDLNITLKRLKNDQAGYGINSIASEQKSPSP
jgi:hypothetical protein